MPTKKDIEEALGNAPNSEYPPELLTSRRAEFVTMVRKYQKPKRPGCPLFGGLMVFVAGGFLFAGYKVYTAIIMEVVSIYMWVLSF